MAIVKYIQNPESKKKIMVDGPTYKTLLKKGIAVDNRTKFPVIETKNRTIEVKTGKGPSDELMQEIMAMNLFTPPPIEKLQKLAKAPYQKRKYDSIKKNVGKGQGSSTRGWSLRSPTKGRQRHKLRKKCGQKCFLGPDESFPICPTCDLYEGDCECLIDCDGVQSAFIRAQQWKYSDISTSAQKILKKKCDRTPKKGILF